MHIARRAVNSALISSIAAALLPRYALGAGGHDHGFPMSKEQTYPNILTPYSEFGGHGLGLAGLNDPTGIFLEDNTLWVADSANHLIKRFSLKGELLGSFGGFGTEPSQLIYPQDITVKDGNIFVINTGNNSIDIYDYNGIHKFRFGKLGKEPGYFNYPHSISVAGGIIYVTDMANNRVQLFSSSGDFINSIGEFGSSEGKFNEPRGIAADENGNFYVADSNNNRIQKFDRHGRFIKAWGSFGSTEGFLAQPSGLSYINQQILTADLLNHRIQIFSEDGQFLKQFGRHPVDGHEGKGRTHYPYRIVSSPNQQILALIEPNENRIQVFETSDMDKFQRVDDDAWWNKGTKFHYGQRATASAGMIGVSEPDTHAVLLFEPTPAAPRFAAILGGRGERPGEFIQPSGIVIRNDSKVIISDSGNRRLQSFNVVRSTQSVTRFGEPNQPVNAEPIRPSVQLAEVVTFSGSKISSEVQRFSGPEQSNNVTPSGMRVGPDGLLYVLDPYNGRAIGLNDNYEAVKSIGRNQSVSEEILRYPLDLAFSKDGNVVYFSDSHGGRVVAFDINGNYKFTIGGHVSTTKGPVAFVMPFGVWAGTDGFLYVTDVGLHKIFKFKEDGTLVKSWGGWGVGPNQYYKPKGISQAPDRRLYVVDFGNHRAQVLSENGDYIAEFGISDSSVISRP
ncbi:NHL repeat-containing protein [Azospirillum palustre]